MPVWYQFIKLIGLNSLIQLLAGKWLLSQSYLKAFSVVNQQAGKY